MSVATPDRRQSRLSRVRSAVSTARAGPDDLGDDRARAAGVRRRRRASRPGCRSGGSTSSAAARPARTPARAGDHPRGRARGRPGTSRCGGDVAALAEVLGERGGDDLARPSRQGEHAVERDPAPERRISSIDARSTFTISPAASDSRHQVSFGRSIRFIVTQGQRSSLRQEIRLSGCRRRSRLTRFQSVPITIERAGRQLLAAADDVLGAAVLVGGLDHRARALGVHDHPHAAGRPRGPPRSGAR